MNDNEPKEVQIFDAAMERPTPGERAAYVRAACGQDVHLRQRVEALLRAAEAAGSFLERPPAEVEVAAARSVGVQASACFPSNAITPAITEKPGDRIGRYKLLEKIGEGGCGVVYVAEQEEPIRRRVALKVIKLGMDTQSVVARFEAERQALALMDHPNIAKVFDAGATGQGEGRRKKEEGRSEMPEGKRQNAEGGNEAQRSAQSSTSAFSLQPSTFPSGRPYFVMELVKGVPITQYCDQQQLSTRERLNLFMQVCHAVQHAHQKGIIHRDLKPSNILVAAADGVPVPKVIDFGIAKATNAQLLTDKTVYTALHQFIGTPAYMSPEQAELSALDIDTRSDIYSLGVLLYELLTGTPPFEPETLFKAGFDEMRRIIRETEPVKPSTRLTAQGHNPQSAIRNPQSAIRNPQCKEVRGDLDWIVMKCLEKDRRRRYETANALADDLERHLHEEPVTAAAPGIGYRLQKFARRHRHGLVTAAAILLLLVAGITASTWQAVRAMRAERAEAAQRSEAEAGAAESRRRLVRLEVANGVRAREEGDALGSLLWFADAMQQEQGDLPAETVHRLRLGCGFAGLPKLVQIWFHESWVNGADFSPDGRRIVTAGSPHARIWDVMTGQPVGLPMPQPRGTMSVRFSADGNHVVTVSGDDSVRVWDAAGGQLATAPMVRTQLVQDAWLSPDGRRLYLSMTAAEGNTDQEPAGRAHGSRVHVWDVHAGREARPPLWWHDGVLALTLSSDGQWLGVVGQRGFAAAWNLRHGNALAFRSGSRGEAILIPPPALGPSESPETHLPDIPAVEGQLRLSEGTPGVGSLAFGPDGLRAVLGCLDGTFEVWSLDTGRRLHTLPHSTDAASQFNTGPPAAQFSPDGRRLLTVGQDGGVRIWETNTGQPVARLGQPAAIGQASFSPDGRWVVTVNARKEMVGAARIWNVSTGEPLFPAVTHAGAIAVALFSPDGCSLLTAGSDGLVRVWSLTTDDAWSTSFLHPWKDVQSHGLVAPQHAPSALQEFTLSEDSRVTDAAFSPDGQAFVSVSANGSARVWDANTGRPMTPFVRSDQPLTLAAFRPDGRHFLTSGGVFLNAQGNQVSRDVGDPDHVAEEGILCVWDARTGQPVASPITLNLVPRRAQFSPDGRWIIVWSRQAVQVWDVATGQPAPLAMKLAGPLRAIAFSPDGRFLATCTGNVGPADPAAARWETRVWDSRSGQPLTPPLRDLGEVRDLQFNPDGRWLVTVEYDPTSSEGPNASGHAPRVRVWRVATGQPMSPPLRNDILTTPIPRRATDVYPKFFFSPDGGFLSVFTTTGISVIWDLIHGRECDAVRLPDQRAVLQALSPDGRLLVSLRGEQTLQVWDALTAEPVTPPLNAGTTVNAVHFSPNGRALLADGGDRAQLWQLAKDDRPADMIVAHAQLLSGRELSGLGGLVPLPTDVLSNRWRMLQAAQPDDFSVNAEAVRVWREREAVRCEEALQWFAAAFHLEQLLKDCEDAPELARRYANARERAALEQLK